MRGPHRARGRPGAAASARRGAVLLSCFALATAACPGDFALEGQTFPCRAAEDCVEGYECDPGRYICVPRGTDASAPAARDSGASPDPLDAGAADAGRARRTIGAECGRERPCDEGTCTDGFCCERTCDEACHRCDRTPGRCLPAEEGTDPDADCGALEFDCSAYTYGLEEGACWSGIDAKVTGGVCGRGGSCRPLLCREKGRGIMISRCENPGCLAGGACPPGEPLADHDEPSELCARGPEARCALGGDEGCCSLLGACCPLPMCLPEAGACE